MQPFELDVLDAAKAVARTELSPVELVESVLGRIEAVEPALNAFVIVLAEQARAAARRAEQDIADLVPLGPLHGVPISFKDTYDVENVRTTASSRLHEDAQPAAADSTIAARLQAAGAIVLGKTQTHELAYGLFTPTTHNPWRFDRSPGGSSGGSAAAVAARMGMASFGTDTGGSIRCPAALCGLVGLKPTFGRVSRRGIMPLARTLDHPGILARTVRDASALLEVIAGYDADDEDSAHVAVPDFTAELERGLDGVTLGVPDTHLFDECDPQVLELVHAAIAVLTANGARLVEVPLPHLDQVYRTETVILESEAAALHRPFLRDLPERYTEAIRRRLEKGLDYAVADYVDAIQLRRKIRTRWRTVFDDVDALIAPVLGGPAPQFGVDEVPYSDGRLVPTVPAYGPQSYPANLAGVPALSVPCGFTGDGIPTGLQIIGDFFDETTVLRIGRAYERLTEWTALTL